MNTLLLSVIIGVVAGESRTDYSNDGCHSGNIDWYCGALF